MNGQKSEFPDKDAKIYWILSYMTLGTAKTWRLCHLSHVPTDNVISPCLCCAKSYIWQDPVNLGFFVRKLWLPAIHVQCTWVYEQLGFVSFAGEVEGSHNPQFLGSDRGRKYVLFLQMWAGMMRRRWWWWRERNVKRWKGDRDWSNGLQHSLLLLMDILSQNSYLLLHGCHAIGKHGNCSHSLSQLLIKGRHWWSRGWLIGRGEEDGRFWKHRRCLAVMGEWHDGQRVIPRVETIVAKILDGIPGVMILIM